MLYTPTRVDFNGVPLLRAPQILDTDYQDRWNRETVALTAGSERSYVGQSRITSFLSAVENDEQSIKLTLLSNDPTWDQSYRQLETAPWNPSGLQILSPLTLLANF